MGSRGKVHVDSEDSGPKAEFSLKRQRTRSGSVVEESRGPLDGKASWRKVNRHRLTSLVASYGDSTSFSFERTDHSSTPFGSPPRRQSTVGTGSFIANRRRMATLTTNTMPDFRSLPSSDEDGALQVLEEENENHILASALGPRYEIQGRVESTLAHLDHDLNQFKKDSMRRLSLASRLNTDAVAQLEQVRQLPPPAKVTQASSGGKFSWDPARVSTTWDPASYVEERSMPLLSVGVKTPSPPPESAPKPEPNKVRQQRPFWEKRVTETMTLINAPRPPPLRSGESDSPWTSIVKVEGIDSESDSDDEMIAELPRDYIENLAVQLEKAAANMDELQEEAAEYLRLGIHAEVKGKLKKAQRYYIQSIQTNAYEHVLSLAKAHLGRTKHKMGILKRAHDDIEAALNLRPELTCALGVRVRMAADEGDDLEAAKTSLKMLNDVKGFNHMEKHFYKALDSHRRKRKFWQRHKKPIALRVDPNIGSIFGSNVICVRGVHFLSNLVKEGQKRNLGEVKVQVFVGDQECTNVVPLTDHKIMAVVPKSVQGPGKYHVVVAVDGCRSRARRDVMYTYERPIISLVSPDCGPMEGGQTVTIEGVYLGCDISSVEVYFGNALAADIEILHGNKAIKCRTPPHNKRETLDVFVVAKVSGSRKVMSRANPFSQYEYLGEGDEEEVELDMSLKKVQEHVNVRKLVVERFVSKKDGDVNIIIENVKALIDFHQRKILNIYRHYCMEKGVVGECNTFSMSSFQFRIFLEESRIIASKASPRAGPKIEGATNERETIGMIWKTANQYRKLRDQWDSEIPSNALTFSEFLNLVLDLARRKYGRGEAPLDDALSKMLHLNMFKYCTEMEDQEMILSFFCSEPVQRIIHKYKVKLESLFEFYRGADMGTNRAVERRFTVSWAEFLVFLRDYRLLEPPSKLSIVTARRAFVRSNLGVYVRSRCTCKGQCFCDNGKSEAERVLNEVRQTKADQLDELSYFEFVECLLRISLYIQGRMERETFGEFQERAKVSVTMEQVFELFLTESISQKHAVMVSREDSMGDFFSEYEEIAEGMEEAQKQQQRNEAMSKGSLSFRQVVELQMRLQRLLTNQQIGFHQGRKKSIAEVVAHTMKKRDDMFSDGSMSVPSEPSEHDRSSPLEGSD